MNDYSLEKAVMNFPKEDQDKIKTMSEENRIESFSVERNLAECKCGNGNIVSVITDVCVKDRSGETHKFRNCGKEISEVISIYSENELDEKDRIKCPECGKEYLDFTRKGFWD